MLASACQLGMSECLLVCCRCGDGLAALVNHVTTWHPSSLLVPAGGFSPAGARDGQSPLPRGHPGVAGASTGRRLTALHAYALQVSAPQYGHRAFGVALCCSTLSCHSATCTPYGCCPARATAAATATGSTAGSSTQHYSH